MDALIPVLWFLTGAAVEVANMWTRKWSVDQLPSGKSAPWLMGGVLLRMVGTAVVLMLAFRHSAASGLAGLAGYMLCRWFMIIWIHRHT